jgi:hypothetical protein
MICRRQGILNGILRAEVWHAIGYLRRLTTAVLIVGALAAPSLAAGKSGVVLGSMAFAPNGWGWGTSKPKSIFNGGDPSGMVTHIHWRSWGGPTAIGFGRNPIFKPKGGYYGRLAKIELRAEDIGSCKGRAAYRQLSVRVPSHPGGKLGPWRPWSDAASICSAPH